MREFKLGSDVMPVRQVSLKIGESVEFTAGMTGAHEILVLQLQGNPYRFPGTMVLYPGIRYRVELTKSHLLMGEVEEGPPEEEYEPPTEMPDDAEKV
jgi:hypothetical protein